ncbi:hypothetical protein D9M73_170130 [compost metagenome]
MRVFRKLNRDISLQLPNCRLKCQPKLFRNLRLFLSTISIHRRTSARQGHGVDQAGGALQAVQRGPHRFTGLPHNGIGQDFTLLFQVPVQLLQHCLQDRSIGLGYLLQCLHIERGDFCVMLDYLRQAIELDRLDQ